MDKVDHEAAHKQGCPALDRSRRDIEACAAWLAYCVSIGWPQSEVDGLERVWLENRTGCKCFALADRKEASGSYRCSGTGHIITAEGTVLEPREVVALLNRSLLDAVPEGWLLDDLTNDSVRANGPFTAHLVRNGPDQYGPDNIKHGHGDTPEAAVLNAAGRVTTPHPRCLWPKKCRRAADGYCADCHERMKP